MGSITSTGCFVFGGIVIAVNYKLLIACTQHTWQSVTLILLSIGSYFAVFLVLDNIPIYNDFGTFQILFVQPISYFAIVFFTFSYVLIDAGAKFANSTVTSWYIKRKSILINKQKKVALQDPAMLREKVSTYHRKYFFSVIHSQVQIVDLLTLVNEAMMCQSLKIQQLVQNKPFAR